MFAHPPPRADIWEWIQTALLAANLVWTTLGLGGYLPQTLVVTGSLTMALVIAHLLAQARVAESWRRIPAVVEAETGRARFHAAGWLMLPFLIYATANVLWVTPAKWLGWQDWFGWAQGIAVFWVVLNGIRSARARQVLFATLLVLGVIGVVLACYQRFLRPDWLMLGRTQAPQFIGRASGSFGIPNSLTGFLLLVIPPCGALAFRRDATHSQRVFFGWMAGVLAVGLLLTISRGGWLALGLALTIWPMFSRRWSLRRRLVAAVAVLLVVSTGLVVLYRSSPKVRDRLALMVRDSGERSRPIMWRAAWMIFRERPWFGSGGGSYNLAFEKHRPDRPQTEPKWAHNEYLNTLSDYGAVGFTLFFGAAGIIAWRAAPKKRRGREARSSDARDQPSGALRPRPPWIDDARFHTALRVGLLAFGFQLLFEFHLKIPALFLTSATIAGLVVAQGWRPSRATPAPGLPMPTSRLACAVLAVVVAVAGMGWILPRLRAEAIRYPLRRELDAMARRELTGEEKVSIARRVRTGLADAVRLDPANASAWADRAYAIAILGHHEREHEITLGREAEADARRALSMCPVAFEFWLRLGVALDMQRRWNDAGPAFSQGLELAPVSAVAWLYQAYHFALNPVTAPLARAAVATCLRLDPGNPQGEALRRHLTVGR